MGDKTLGDRRLRNVSFRAESACNQSMELSSRRSGVCAITECLQGKAGQIWDNCQFSLNPETFSRHNLLLNKLLAKNVPHCLIKWLFSYFDKRSQSVRIGNYRSRKLYLNGAMPQGSFLGPLCFLVLIDDLNVGCLTHKYVDDTTLTELLPDRS